MSQEVQHFFELISYTSPTQCVVCKTFIWGQVKQGFCCKGCHANVHKKCVDAMKSIKCDANNPQLAPTTMQPIMMKRVAPPPQQPQQNQQGNQLQAPLRPSSGSGSGGPAPMANNTPQPVKGSPTPGRVQIQIPNPGAAPMPKRTAPPPANIATPPGTPPPSRLGVSPGTGSRPNSGSHTPITIPPQQPPPVQPVVQHPSQAAQHPPQQPAAQPQRPAPAPNPAVVARGPPQGPPPNPKRSSLGPHPVLPPRDPSPQPARPEREPVTQPVPQQAPQHVRVEREPPQATKAEPVQVHVPPQPNPMQQEMEKTLKGLQESIVKNQQTIDSQEFTMNINTKQIEKQQATLITLEKQIEELNKQKALLEAQVKELEQKKAEPPQERSRSLSRGQGGTFPRTQKSNSLSQIPDVNSKPAVLPLSQSHDTNNFYNTEDSYNNNEEQYNNSEDGIYNNTPEPIKIVDYGAKIRALGCYFGSITRQVAEQILAGFGPNYYLVRDSSVQDSFAVSFILGSEFHHTLVTTTYIGVKFVEAEAIYGSLEELLANNDKMYGLLPLDKSAFEQTQKPISIRIPEANQTASIPQDSPLIVKDLIKTLAQKASLKNPDEFGIYIPEENQWIANDKLFSSIRFDSIKEGLVMQRKTRLYLIIRVGGKDINIDLKKEATVKEAIEAIQKQIKTISSLSSLNTANYGLFMLSDKLEEGILMQESKSVRTYKMKLSDKLEFKEKDDNTKNNFFIVIDSPSHGYSQTLKFKGDPLVRDVLLEFVSKNPIENPGSYGLVKIDSAKKNLNLFQRQKTKSKEQTWLDPARPLSFYNIKSMDIICFKQRMRHRTISRLEGVVKKQWFGVDPANIESEVDPSNGLKVPKILIMLKDCMVRHGGLQREGIFRIAGSESMIKDIKYQLNTSLFKDTSEVDCVAALIKRWFGELPTRLFASLTMAMLEAAVDDIDETMNLLNKLPEKEKNLYMWLLDLMFSVAQYEDINKMTPENIAICVAPQLMDNPSENPMEAILTNQKLCTIVSNSIIWKRKQLEQSEDSH